MYNNYHQQSEGDLKNDEMKTELLKQQIQSFQATQLSEITTQKAFKSYKEPEPIAETVESVKESEV